MDRQLFPVGKVWCNFPQAQGKFAVRITSNPMLVVCNNNNNYYYYYTATKKQNKLKSSHTSASLTANLLPIGHGDQTL
jgi:hypothetical protein